ncbi:MAG: hypothetical protein JNM59_09720 [Hyphomonadaceae bacterium]|nr:hypothetical protein [Hyphomonadaceae bacterium]
MAGSTPSDGRRDLALLRASGSTARVLNLALVYERSGQTPEFAARPLFRTTKLNRALIIKHALRDHERSLFDRPEPHTTKIVFPYSATELGLGGTSVMVGERRFDQLLRNAVGGSVEPDDFAADLDLITLLHELPSFDPFLLREQLKRAGYEPAKCFFELSDADVENMLVFVQREIEPLASMAFGAAGRRAEKLSMRLAQKLMTDESAQLLAPLRETLRLTPWEFAEGAFAWKGFLYYKWMLRDFAATRAHFNTRFFDCVIVTEDRRVRYEVDRLRQDISARVDMVAKRAAAALSAYDRVFGALTRGDPTPFRDFLLDAPAKFVSLGEALGAVKHIYTFWGFRFPDKAPLRLEAAEAQDILQEFERMLNGIQLLGNLKDDDVLVC